MKPTETLEHEHETILAVLDATTREAESIRTSGKVRGVVVREILDFFRGFVDRCHHAKEEQFLFPGMIERGMPSDSGLIPVLLAEHDAGREYARSIAQTLPEALVGDGDALDDIAENLDSYAGLLRMHIEKENTILFPIADNLLTPEDETELDEAFERIEREELGAGAHERYHALAFELSQGTVEHA